MESHLDEASKDMEREILETFYDEINSFLDTFILAIVFIAE